ncbi:unnamed protein product [Amoebophrya sp. A120]|nr:unnamed protein product [Amoebophrya sp. A120]|eukprot:GSA120T00015796001.1
MALAPGSTAFLSANDLSHAGDILAKENGVAHRHASGLFVNRAECGVSSLPRVIQTHQDVKSLCATVANLDMAIANLSQAIDPSAVSLKLQETAVNVETTALRIGGLEAGLGSVAEAATAGNQLVEKLNKLEAKMDAKMDAIQAELKETKARVAQVDKEMCRCVIM